MQIHCNCNKTNKQMHVQSTDSDQPEHSPSVVIDRRVQNLIRLGRFCYNYDNNSHFYIKILFDGKH